MNVWARAGREPRELIQAWHRELQRVARSENDSIEMRVNRYWIAFRSEKQGRAFAEVRPSRSSIEVFILPERRNLSDPGGIARTAPRTQGWNWFRTKFRIVGNGHGRAALSLLRQSYESPARAAARTRATMRARQVHLRVGSG